MTTGACANEVGGAKTEGSRDLRRVSISSNFPVWVCRRVPQDILNRIRPDAQSFLRTGEKSQIAWFRGIPDICANIPAARASIKCRR
jgi:hypothetical protein